MSATLFKVSLMVAIAAVGLVACGDIDTRVAPNTTTTTVPAATTTTVDHAAIEAWLLAVQEQQQAEQARAETNRRTTRTNSGGARNQSTGGLIAAQNPCAIPAHICTRESNNTLNARNPSGAAGKYQFMPGTWNGYGGYTSADQAPEEVQDAKARELWAGGAGCGHWQAC